jgi:hypothetical protein
MYIIIVFTSFPGNRFHFIRSSTREPRTARQHHPSRLLPSRPPHTAAHHGEQTSLPLLPRRLLDGPSTHHPGSTGMSRLFGWTPDDIRRTSIVEGLLVGRSTPSELVQTNQTFSPFGIFGWRHPPQDLLSRDPVLLPQPSWEWFDVSRGPSLSMASRGTTILSPSFLHPLFILRITVPNGHPLSRKRSKPKSWIHRLWGRCQSPKGWPLREPSRYQ